MTELLLFLSLFIFVFLIYYIFVIKNKKKLKKLKNTTEYKYLNKIYGIEHIKDMKKLAFKISLANSFILSLAVSLVNLFNEVYLKVTASFIILIPVMLLTYHVLGKSLTKGEK